MGLFSKLFGDKNDKETGVIDIVAPIAGKIKKIEDVPDVVFAEKIVGDGVAIEPTGDKMVAPVDGTISKIFETNHAFSMETDNGVQLFVHFGIDTVELKGEGFRRVAKEGQRVKKGDVIIELDIPRLKQVENIVMDTPVVISNLEETKEMNKLPCDGVALVAGETPILRVRK